MTVLELINQTQQQLTQAGVGFGHGTTNAFDEAAWLVLWRLGLPLDSALDSSRDDAPPAVGQQAVSAQQVAQVNALVHERISSRKPAAYLTREAWLQGVAFYVDERAIVPRSLIAELLADGSIDPWLGTHTQRVLDLCTGNGSLGVLAALTYPDISVLGTDLSSAALAVARINVERHALAQRMSLIESDGLAQVPGKFDLILCNPPYVNAHSMAHLPAEYRAEPALALDGNAAGGSDGMDFIRQLLQAAPDHMNEQAVLVLEIGNEQAHFEAAFAHLEVIWLDTSAGDDHVLLITRDALRLWCDKRHQPAALPPCP